MKLSRLIHQPALWVAVIVLAIVAMLIHMPVPEATATALAFGDLGPLAGLGLLGVTISPDVMRNLYTGFKASFNAGRGKLTPQWSKVATRVPSSTSQEDYGWLGELPGIREWIGDRVVRGLSESGYTIKNKSFEQTVGVSRDRIEDDQYGIYAPLMESLGEEVDEFPDELVFGLLQAGFTTPCYDGQYFFDTDHPVGQGVVSNMQAGAGNPWFLLQTNRVLKPLIFQERKRFEFVAMTKPDDEAVFTRKEFRYGVDGRCNAGFGFWKMAYASRAELNAANYDVASTAMKSFKRENGNPAGIKPNLLVYGPSNSSRALEVIKAERDAYGATNIHRDTVDLLEVPWLL